MQILLLNPNTTVTMTDRMMAVAGNVVQPGTQLVPATATRGVPYIASRSEAQIAGTVVLEMLAERHQQFDAAIIAAFGDPGLMAARELFDLPVVGMAEAAMLTACMLGGSFSIVSFSATLSAWYRECVAVHKLGERCASIRTLTEDVDDVVAVGEQKEELLVALCRRAVVDDGADVIVLAGAPLVGLAERVRDRVPVPIVDQIVAATKQAEALVAINARAATAGSFGRPAGKPSIGLPEPLSQWMGKGGPVLAEGQDI